MGDSFLFINYDPKTVGSRINAKKVYAHVQNHHQQRKRDKSTHLRRRVLLPSARLRPFDPMANGQQAFALAGVSSWQEQDQSSSPKTTNDTTNKSVFAVPLLHAQRILQKGNTDPFSALAIHVTPSINGVISWHRGTGIPALYPLESGILGWPSPAMYRTWQDAVAYIQQPSQVYPYLASVSASMARRTGREDIAKLSLRLKDRSYRVLRALLAETSNLNTLKVYNVIIYMVWAELIGGDRSAAEMHLRMLAKLLRSHSNLIELDAWTREKFLVADVNLAILGMTRPLLDVAGWYLEGAYLDWMDDLQPSDSRNIDAQSDGLDDSVTDERLRAIFNQLRELLFVQELVARGRLKRHSVFRWIDSRLLTCESRLVSLYTDLSPCNSTTCGQSTADLDQSPILACACIAALAWTCMVFGSSSRALIGTMTLRLQTAIQHCKDQRWCGKFRLWALFTGAELEKLRTTNADGAFDNGWHNTSFRKEAESLGLHSSCEIREVLQGFLFSVRMNSGDLVQRV